MKQESSPLKNLVVPAAVLPFLAPMAAFAAEGTGRVSFHHRIEFDGNADTVNRH